MSSHPPVVKYQAKKETQVTKTKFFKMYSAIKKNAGTETKFHDFSLKMSLFWKYHDFSMHGIF